MSSLSRGQSKQILKETQWNILLFSLRFFQGARGQHRFREIAKWTVIGNALSVYFLSNINNILSYPCLTKCSKYEFSSILFSWKMLDYNLCHKLQNDPVCLLLIGLISFLVCSTAVFLTSCIRQQGYIKNKEFWQVCRKMCHSIVLIYINFDRK